MGGDNTKGDNINKDGEVKVNLEKNKLKAYLQVVPPIGSGQPVTLEEIKKVMNENNIKHGIDEKQIKKALLEKNWGQKILIAEGKPAEVGKNAKIDFKFPLLSERLGPKIDEEGNANYHDLGLIYNVKMGELLAEKTLATPGIPGIDITGKEIKPKAGVDFRIPRGKNTFCNDDETMLLAATDGNVTIRDNKIVIDPVFEVPGDVDFSSGNIDFVGDVVINGSVNSGFKVEAGGDIEIMGFVEGAQVISKGSILVRGGITTGNKGFVKAANDLGARFVENSRIEAGGDIIIREAIMQSTVRAGRSVRVHDKKAIILGGLIQAAEEVESRVLGSQLATGTIVEVGINPHFREEYQHLNKTRNEKKKKIDNINHNLQVYQRRGISPEKLDNKRKLALIKMLDDFKALRQELQTIEDRIVSLEDEFQKSSNAKIKVLDIVHPGVRITIGQAIFIVNDPIKYSAFILEDGEVKITSLS
ncbi:MAG TPA: FapA family protein [Syntrophomonadaceae bacterium]|nr:FapA family protein [Syntrophomonadaceae bacterium]